MTTYTQTLTSFLNNCLTTIIYSRFWSLVVSSKFSNRKRTTGAVDFFSKSECRCSSGCFFRQPAFMWNSETQSAKATESNREQSQARFFQMLKEDLKTEKRNTSKSRKNKQATKTRNQEEKVVWWSNQESTYIHFWKRSKLHLQSFFYWKILKKQQVMKTVNELL